MSEAGFFTSVFAVVEHLTRSEVSDRAKWLIRYYYDEVREGSCAERGWSAVQRYTQEELPTLESVRSKSARGDLSRLDHLLLRMDYEAAKLQQD